MGCGPGALGQVPGDRNHPPEAGAWAALFLLLPASVYPGDINGTGRTRHRSLTLLGPEDSEGQWQVKNFKRAVSWPVGGQTPLGCRGGVLSPPLLTALLAPTDAASAMNSPEGPNFPARLLSGGASPSGDEGFFPFVLERRDSFLGGGPGPEEPEDLALQLQQKEKDLLLCSRPPRCRDPSARPAGRKAPPRSSRRP